MATELVLVFRAISGGEPYLAQCVVEAAPLSDLGQLDVVVERPARALFDFADHKAAAHVGNPIGELDRGGLCRGDVFMLERYRHRGDFLYRLESLPNQAGMVSGAAAAFERIECARCASMRTASLAAAATRWRTGLLTSM